MEDKSKEKFELIKKSFEFKNLKKYKEAIELLYKALELGNSEDDNVEVLSQIGDLHLLLDNHERALDEFNRALAINKNHNYSRQKCFDIYLSTNRLTKALNIAQKMCEENKTPQSYYNYLKALIKSDKYQDAIEIFNSLDDTIKLDVDILYLISTISPNNKQAILERIIDIDETHQKANLDLAKIAFENRDWNNVVKYCLNLDENNPLGLYYLAVVETKKNNLNYAIELFIKAIKYDNDNHDFYLDLAKAYIDSSRFTEALEVLKQSINYSLIRNNLDALDEKYFLSGWILIKQNEPTKALLNLNSINSQSKLYNTAQVLIQTINLSNKNLSEAKNHLEKYYELEPANPILLDSLAGVYKELKLYKKAIETYKKALKLYPESLYYVLEIIDLLIDDKNYDEAMEIINSIKEKYSNCANIYNSLARIYYRLNDLNSALEAITKYLELDKNRAESFYFKGLILNDLNNFEEAKGYIYTAIRLHPIAAKYYSQMARAYFGIEQFENALLYAKEAIEIDKDNIKYKKQAYEISLKLNDADKINMYENMLKQSEKILKLNR